MSYATQIIGTLSTMVIVYFIGYQWGKAARFMKDLGKIA